MDRLQKYELALWAGVSAQRLHGADITLSEWRAFSENLEIEQRYPGINGIGVIHKVSQEEMGDYLAVQRRDRPDFNVHPSAEREEYAPITYIEPTGINAQAVGLDMMHEVNRRTSFIKSGETASAQITGPIILVQDSGRTPGFLFFAPFYSNDGSEKSENRREKFVGAVYAPFIVHKLIAGTLGIEYRSSLIQIFDEDSLIYDEFSEEYPSFDPSPLGQKTIKIPAYGREWVVNIRTNYRFRSNVSAYEPTVILIIGLLIDFAIFGVFILLMRANRRGLQFAEMASAALQAESNSLKIANDDLKVARLAAESASAAKSMFLSTMSHEVRTPLTAISGVLVLLERAGLPDHQDKLVKAGAKASDRLMKLLTDVLDVSRLEAKAVSIWQRQVKVPELIEEWHILADGMIERLGKEIVVTSEHDDSTPETIYVDDIRLSQVMNNLMDNAARFTEKGEIKIKASGVSDGSGEIGKLVLSISDTGAGIAEEDISLIFERFRQVDGSIIRKNGGSGLGLTICYDLVNLMGGEITVLSTLGVGTVFTVSLPSNGTNTKGAGIV